MAESVAPMVDHVLHGYPIRQWVLSLPIPLRLMLARYPSELGKVVSIIQHALQCALRTQASMSKSNSILAAPATFSPTALIR